MRYTLGIWRKNFSYDSFGHNLEQSYKRNGVSARLGAKFISTADIRKTRFYIEPQVRYHNLKGDFSDDDPNATTKYEVEKGTHFAILFGIQRQNRPKSFVFDAYIGVGILATTIKATVTGGHDETLYGQESIRSTTIPGIYIGTALGVNLRNTYKGDVRYTTVVEGELLVSKQDNFYGGKNKYGFLVIPYDYNSLSAFRDGLSAAQKNGKYGYINLQNQVLIGFEYDAANSFNEGVAAVQQGGKWGFIDRTGEPIIALTYDHADSFKDGIALVQQGEKWFYINKKAEFVKDF